MKKKPADRLKSPEEVLDVLNSIKITDSDISKSHKVNPKAILDESKAGVKNVIKSVNPHVIFCLL